VCMEEIEEIGYKHIHYQCHYSAKAISILNENVLYYTGFVTRTCPIYPIITHSFNYYKDKVLDLSRINNPEYPLPEDCNLPHTYYGIKIPNEFVLEYHKETMENHSMNPLLYEWYIKNN
ncbi:MAG: hypothetical protein WCY89_12050, partial [Flavobacteriaceae bacterium]